MTLNANIRYVKPDGTLTVEGLQALGAADAASGGGTWGTITGTLSAQGDLQGALDAKANASHSHVSGDVTNFSEAVDDRVAALLVAGSNVTLTYNDGAGTLTVAAAGGGSAADTFETVAKNLAAIDNTGEQVSATTLVVTYANGIIKTVEDTGATVTITLSGSTPGGIDLVKTITFTGDDFVTAYS